MHSIGECRPVRTETTMDGNRHTCDMRNSEDRLADAENMLLADLHEALEEPHQECATQWLRQLLDAILEVRQLRADHANGRFVSPNTAQSSPPPLSNTSNSQLSHENLSERLLRIRDSISMDGCWAPIPTGVRLQLRNWLDKRETCSGKAELPMP